MNHWLFITGGLGLLTFVCGLYFLMKDYHQVQTLNKGKGRILFPDIGLIVCSLLWAGLAIGLYVVFQNQALLMSR